MSICVGEVIEVRGTQVIIEAYNKQNKDILFDNGKKYQGIAIGGYLLIKRGLQDIACKIEGEYLDEKKCNQENGKITYHRKVIVKPMGYFTVEDDKFHQGIKFLPMLKDSAYLINQECLEAIYSIKESDFVIGKTIKEDIPINLPWEKLFASHIAIFGNTGSGKSNTLAKIYTELLQKKQSKINGKSKFIVLDFNGEYTGDQFLNKDNKNIIELNTRNRSYAKQNKFELPKTEFWNAEMLSILFKATQNTQQPFIKRVIKGRKDNEDKSLTDYIQAIFYRCLIDSTSPKRETLDILKDIIENYTTDKNLNKELTAINWHSKNQKFFYKDLSLYQHTPEYETKLKEIKDKIQIKSIDYFDELIIRSKLKLASDLNTGYVQFDHINPMINRIKSSLKDLKKVINVVQVDSKNSNNDKFISIISLRNCNQEIKKILPLIIAKYLYHKHKQEVKNPIDKTMHLIIDEAHNILSNQSLNEHESWKDYRLELFEEIIKEGRKFGMFLTLSSQRPADISPTIVSQIHNFFIHRLVNDKDLQLLDNTISTLDSLSKGMIPNLSKGGCIVTGVSFDIPLVLQIDLLPDKKHQPDSEDVNLDDLWK